MKMMNRYAFILLSSAVLLCGFFELGLSREDSFHKMKFGGVQRCKGSQNGAEMENLARFAVQEHNKKENSLLEFSRVLKAREQVVAGMMYHLTLEAVDAGKKKIYQAKVWVKPWMNFKKLEEFKHAKDGPSFTTSDLGLKHDGSDLEWQEVPTNDLEVQGAASYAVKSIQQSSNSLNPYELLEILHAKAKVIEDYARYELHLKLQWGVEEVKFQVEVIKNSDGKFHLKYFN